jgi:hypothetical protein
LIEENVLIEIATVTYSKSLWMILKETRTTVDECLALVGSIIDPNTGALGKQALSPLYDSLMKVFGKIRTINTIKYYFST